MAVSGAAVILSPLAVLIVPGLFTLGGFNALFILFSGIGVAGLGLLSCIGMLALTRLFVRGTAAYVRFNARIVMRKPNSTENRGRGGKE